MNEDDTFRMLKSLTYEEAAIMSEELYLDIITSERPKSLGDARRLVDMRLKPYGWSISMLDDLDDLDD